MKAAILLFSLLFCVYGFSQNENAKYLTINAISGGLTSGFMACLHKPAKDDLGKVFLNAFWKGCAGGSVSFAGKKMIEYTSGKNSYGFVWPARLVNSLGSSMILNGSLNQKLLSSFSVDLFLIHLKIDQKSVTPQLDLLTFGSSAYFLCKRKYSFDLTGSLLTGCMFFDKKSDDHIYDGHEEFGLKGMSLGNTIWRKKIQQYYYTTNIEFSKDHTSASYDVQKTVRTFDKTIALHEVIHTFQYSEQTALNLKFLQKVKFLFINPSFLTTYSMSSLFSSYTDVYFEKESRHFSGEIDYLSNSETHISTK